MGAKTFVNYTGKAISINYNNDTALIIPSEGLITIEAEATEYSLDGHGVKKYFLSRLSFLPLKKTNTIYIVLPEIKMYIECRIGHRNDILTFTSTTDFSGDMPVVDLINCKINY